MADKVKTAAEYAKDLKKIASGAPALTGMFKPQVWTADQAAQFLKGLASGGPAVK